MFASLEANPASGSSARKINPSQQPLAEQPNSLKRQLKEMDERLMSQIVVISHKSHKVSDYGLEKTVDSLNRKQVKDRLATFLETAKGAFESSDAKKSKELYLLFQNLDDEEKHVVVEELNLLAAKSFAKTLEKILPANPSLVLGYLEDEARFTVLKSNLEKERIGETISLCTEEKLRLETVEVIEGFLTPQIHQRHTTLINIYWACIQWRNIKDERELSVYLAQRDESTKRNLENDGYDFSNVSY